MSSSPSTARSQLPSRARWVPPAVLELPPLVHLTLQTGIPGVFHPGLSLRSVITEALPKTGDSR